VFGQRGEGPSKNCFHPTNKLGEETVEKLKKITTCRERSHVPAAGAEVGKIQH